LLIPTWSIQFFLTTFGQSDVCKHTIHTPENIHKIQCGFGFYTLVMVWWRSTPCLGCLFNLGQLDLHLAHGLLPQQQWHLYTSQRYERTTRGKGFLLTSNNVDLCELLRWLNLGYELPTCFGWASNFTWVACTLHLGIISYVEVSQRLTNQSCI
jgi:hypothetical protein